MKDDTPIPLDLQIIEYAKTKLDEPFIIPTGIEGAKEFETALSEAYRIGRGTNTLLKTTSYIHKSLGLNKSNENRGTNLTPKKKRRK